MNASVGACALLRNDRISLDRLETILSSKHITVRYCSHAQISYHLAASQHAVLRKILSMSPDNTVTQTIKVNPLYPTKVKLCYTLAEHIHL